MRPSPLVRAGFALLLAGLAACAGPAAEPDPPAVPPASAPEPEGPGDLIDVWAAVPVGMARLGGADVPDVCDGPFGTWFAGFGVRGLACAASQKVPLGEAAGRAPVPVWTGGPHFLDGPGLDLGLYAARDFGRYNPEFVRWAVANAVPRSPAGVALARPVYERHVRRLARVYWLSYASLAADGFPDRLPAGGPAAYAAYLDGGPVPEGAAGYVYDGAEARESGVSVFALFDERSGPIAAAVTRQMAPRAREGVVTDWNEWEVRYEANTALGFWLRRRADGTLALFHGGLADVLGTFDAEWLAAHG